MEDSGAVFTTETIRNSELNDAIFKIFALKLVELTSIKVLAKNVKIRPHYEQISKIPFRG